MPVAAGGGVDTFARLIAAKAKTLRDVTFIVENRTGGNSTIGGLEVQRAAPDGYTVLFHASTHNVARLVLKNAPYDPLADFTPIALAGHAPLVLIIANNRPEKTLAEIVAAAKKDPTRPGRSGPRSSARPAISRRWRSTNTPAPTCRSFPIAAPRRPLNDVVGGHVPLMIEAILALLPAVRAGSVRAVAVTGNKRSKLAPEIPTMAEVGLPQLNFGAWWGMWGPPNMPAELTKTINGLVNEAVKELGAEGRLDALGIEPAQETPQAFAQFIASRLDRSAKLLEGRELPAGVKRATHFSGSCSFSPSANSASDARVADRALGGAIEPICGGRLSVPVICGFRHAGASSAFGQCLRHRGDLSRCSSIAAANSAPVPGRISAPVGFSRSATAGSAATARTSAAILSFIASGMSRQP